MPPLTTTQSEDGAGVGRYTADPALGAGDAPAAIRVRGAATHNLRDVDLDLPRNELIVFCGVSGSGKTSMAIDTLYAEGQRRYIESFSTYTRQFLEQLDKPAVEKIEGLPPALAVRQGAASRSNRATVATATEVADHLRLIYARAGGVVCPDCDRPVRRDTVESIAEQLAATADGTRLMLGFRAPTRPGGERSAWAADLIAMGYVRWIIGGETRSIDPHAAKEINAEPINADGAIVLVDRLVASPAATARLTESVESALAAGDQSCVALIEAEGDTAATAEIDGRRWREVRFSSALRCDACDRGFAEPTPALLNFNSPLGACPECEGFGSVAETDMDLVVPDRGVSVRDGAVAPWNTPAYKHELEELLALADDYAIPVDAPFSELSEQHVRLIVEGVPERDFGGLNGFFRWLERRKYKMHLRVYLSRWRSYRECPACGGARLRPDALAIRFAGKNLAELCGLKTIDAMRLLESVLKDPHRVATATPTTARAVALPILERVVDRLRYLVDVGLGYVTLDRPLRTLSSGEAQRVAMTSTLGSSLVDMLYVLDEPSAGLHPVDVSALAGAIGRLRDRGNTVVVVEHEEAFVRAADHVVEFGPQAGVEGGRVVFQGSPEELLTATGSRTGDWLAGRRAMTIGRRRTPTAERLQLRGARGNNLRTVDADFPLGLLTLVTGVSGAGKSSLVLRTLYPALAALIVSRKGAARSRAEGPKTTGAKSIDAPLPYAELLGAGPIDGVQLIDGAPISRSPRSNPVTYVKAFDPIRALFAEQPDAQARGLTASHFSFNVDGGRCDTCQGAGYLEVDMQFMPDVYMRCSECDGRRYRREVLDVRYRGRDISEVLEMTAHEALRFFRGQNKVQAKLKVLLDVGLDYLRLGQPANTLSGGEAQRLKLAGTLAGKQSGRTLFVLDEPSTGLHYSDVVQLIDCFDALVDVGHTLVVVDHNPQLMLAADRIIDLGPGAAEEGGGIVAAGTPEEVAACADSATGRVLADTLRCAEAAATALADEPVDG
ncbi:MAG: excinuclease ABC subunit UvrA [Planctomycetota bacterium]